MPRFGKQEVKLGHYPRLMARQSRAGEALRPSSRLLPGNLSAFLSRF
jgi:hypothetical protein